MVLDSSTSNTANVPVQGTLSSDTSSASGTTTPIPVHNQGKNKILFICSLVLIFFACIFAVLFFTLRPPKKESGVTKPIIKLAVNPWKASELNAAIAKIILEEHMGFSVKLIPIDENAQWEALTTGEIDASLEVWPSGHKKNIQKYILTDKSVEEGGYLGPIGKIGWFIPKYLKDEHPDLATWEGFKDPKNISLFSSDGVKGQFYTGDPTWTQYDDQIIKNLGLNFDVKVLGSEEALIKAVDEAYVKKNPIVFYFWTPHWAHALYDLEPVELPPYNEECYSDIKGGVNCDYPRDQLFKIFWSGFKDYAPQAYQFLVKFNYTNQDQIGMLAAVQLNKKSVDEVARLWITNNESVWKRWMP